MYKDSQDTEIENVITLSKSVTANGNGVSAVIWLLNTIVLLMKT